MAANIVIRADVVDISKDTPRNNENFLVDTNVWYWMTYSKASLYSLAGLCCTSRKADEITPAPDAAMPWHPRAPCSGARVA